MSSMSYCRFENTAVDFEQCVSDLQEGRKLSEREERFRHRLYELAQEYIEAYDEYSPVSEEDDDEEV